MFTRQRVTGVQQRHQGLAEQFHRVQFGGQLQRADHADLQFLVDQRLADLATGHFLQVEVHGRERLAKGEHGSRDDRHEWCRGGETDLQLTDLALLGAAHYIHRLAHLRERLAGFLEEQPAGVGKRYVAVGALEQAHPELVFQRLNLLTERRLGDAQQLRGAAEMQLFGNGYEVA